MAHIHRLALLTLLLVLAVQQAQVAPALTPAVHMLLSAARTGRVSEAHLKQLEALLDLQVVRQCLAFLVKHMPQSDRGSVSPQSLRTNVLLALAAREAHGWSAAVPWPVFLNDVLPYANLDEPRDDWRLLFAPLLAPLVLNATSITDAAQVLNRDIWGLWGIVFKAHQTPDIMSPSQVIQHGYASCTGLSIFLVDALRSVGIPARVAGTPCWTTAAGQALNSDAAMHGGVELARLQVEPAARWGPPFHKAGQDDHVYNNHDWVEVWDGGSWSFVGAAEWDARGMNRTWFFPEPVKHQIPGSRMHAVYAASFAPPPDGCGDKVFPLVWNLNNTESRGCDVTQVYLDASAAESSQHAEHA